jgi:hypothetical protein
MGAAALAVLVTAACPAQLYWVFVAQVCPPNPPHTSASVS